MSYEKHTWETGETITAEKLNNLENGVASGGGSDNLCAVFTIVFGLDDNDEFCYYLEDGVTFNALFEAAASGKIVVLYDHDAGKYYYINHLDEDTHELIFSNFSEALTTDSLNNRLIQPTGEK